MQCFIYAVHCSEQSGQCYRIEDEILKDDEIIDSSETNMDELANPMDDSNDEPEYTCPCMRRESPNIIADENDDQNQNNGMDGLMGMLGAKSGMAMPPFGNALPSDFDPMDLSMILMQVLSSLKDKIQTVMNQTVQQVCPRIKPIDIFLQQSPYLAYEEVLTKEAGEEANAKIDGFQADLKNFIGEKHENGEL